MASGGGTPAACKAASSIPRSPSPLSLPCLHTSRRVSPTRIPNTTTAAGADRTAAFELPRSLSVRHERCARGRRREPSAGARHEPQDVNAHDAGKAQGGPFPSPTSATIGPPRRFSAAARIASISLAPLGVFAAAQTRDAGGGRPKQWAFNSFPVHDACVRKPKNEETRCKAFVLSLLLRTGCSESNKCRNRPNAARS